MNTVINYFDHFGDKDFALTMINRLESRKAKRGEELVREFAIASAKHLLDIIENTTESKIETAFGYLLVVATLECQLLLVPAYVYIDDLDKKSKGITETLLDAFTLSDVPIVYLSTQEILPSNKRLDFAIHVVRKDRKDSLAIELDGYEFHKDRFKEDRIKQREAVKHGYKDFYRFSGKEIFEDLSVPIKETIVWINEKLAL